jgi:tRNA-2-methylthio-N6-dimethylallyladenosine synthase
MRYHIWTIGCQMNAADSQQLASALEQMGYTWSPQAESADVVVLNTCVVRQQAEDKIYGRLGGVARLKAGRPDMVVALMGCLVGHKPSRVLADRFPQVDVFLPPSDPGPLLEHLRDRALSLEARRSEAETVAARWAAQDGGLPGSLVLPAHERGTLVTANVPIMFGCNWVCTYCIVPSRRGPERSRPAADVVTHVRSLVDQGVREVTLLGQIVDRFGHDRGEVDALPGLLATLNDIDGLERIRFLTSHPNFVTDALLDAVADLPKVMEHVEVPVQAGDDAVLTRMKRRYTVAEYRRLVDRIRARVPGVAVHTDVIVGFPGETAAQFDATCALLAELRLDKAHIARFSPRPGTVAAKVFDDDIPSTEKDRRRSILDGLQAEICAEINATQLGRTVQVLVEGRHGARWRGRTRTNKLVFFPDDRPLLGRLVDVAIAWTGPWSMIGEAADRRDANAATAGGLAAAAGRYREP